RTPARLSAVAEHAAELDLASEPVRAFLRLLKERHTVVDPTVTFYEDKFTGRPGQVSPSLAAVAGRLPYPVRRGLLGGHPPAPPPTRTGPPPAPPGPPPVPPPSPAVFHPRCGAASSAATCRCPLEWTSVSATPSTRCSPWCTPFTTR